MDIYSIYNIRLSMGVSMYIVDGCQMIMSSNEIKWMKKWNRNREIVETNNILKCTSKE